ncbi:HIT domain-containing protein [Patescibacteria group bacterium]|nr:HIT domain-containing protein [Patescibacteria group bacterium]MBU1015592.1 HIT domain-containing protein [Patescibacteria group bacterium]MBU1684999.1 HIT domain-containing protein [Patescibacteria group bacterium]MBU1938105.1 HIT domain-containing protein [Patescibacteria group bacterium]
MMEDCLFCKIAAKEIPADMVSESEEFVAFNDINPRARHHILIIPRKHIPSMNELNETEEDDALIGRMMLFARDLAKEKGFNGHQLQFHVGRGGGQIIFHVHMHLMSN